MDIRQIKEDILIQDWHDTVNPSLNTRNNHMGAITRYCMFLNMTPTQLIDEAEEDATKLPRHRRIRQHLNAFSSNLISRNLSEWTIHTYFVSIYSFYRAFDVDIPRNIKRKRAVAKKENMQIPTIEQLQHVLKTVGVMERAIILVGCASGLASNEILELRVCDFLNEYDEQTGITTLHVRRAKTNYDHVTFLTPEASEAVRAYIDYRNTRSLSDDYKSHNAAEKRHVASDSDYLFIKTRISDKYLQTRNEELRKMKRNNVIEMYEKISRETGQDVAESWNLIRSHNMRKVFFSNLINAGCDSMIAEYFMGHTLDGNKTAYFRASPDKLKEIYTKYVHALTIQPIVDVEKSEEYNRMLKENQQYAVELGHNTLINEMNARKIEAMSKVLDTFTDIVKKRPDLMEVFREELS